MLVVVGGFGCVLFRGLCWCCGSDGLMFVFVSVCFVIV